MVENILIRQIGPGDFEAFDLIFKLFLSHANNDIPEKDEIKKLFTKAISEDCNITFMGAFFNEELVGIISYSFVESSYKARPFLWCDDFYIHQKYRRMGIGKTLIQALEKVAKDNSCSGILCGVGEDESDAQRFYKANKFIDLQNKIYALPTD